MEQGRKINVIQYVTYIINNKIG